MENYKLILVSDEPHPPTRKEECKKVYETDRAGGNVVHHYLEIWENKEGKIYLRNFLNTSNPTPVAVAVSERDANRIMNATGDESFEIAFAII